MDEIVILNLLERYFSRRGYEVLTFTEPNVCPIYEDSTAICMNKKPCGDIILVDFKMPRMNGIELLEYQDKQGCKLDIGNKAVISGYMEDEYLPKVSDIGCAFFKKPFNFADLSIWLDKREKNIDFSQPVGIKREISDGLRILAASFRADVVHEKSSLKISKD